MVSSHAQVLAICHGHHADAGLPSLGYGDVHGLGGSDYAEPVVGVDGGGGEGFAEDADFRTGVECALLVTLNVLAQQVRDAVGVDAAQIGGHEHVGGDAGVFVGHGHFAENGGYGGSQGCFFDPYGVLFHDLEPF